MWKQSAEDWIIALCKPVAFSGDSRRCRSWLYPLVHRSRGCLFYFHTHPSLPALEVGRCCRQAIPDLKIERKKENRELKLTKTQVTTAHAASELSRYRRAWAEIRSFSPQLSTRFAKDVCYNTFTWQAKTVLPLVVLVRWVVNIHTCIAHSQSSRLDAAGHTWPAWHRGSRTVAQPRRSWVGYAPPRREKLQSLSAVLR